MILTVTLNRPHVRNAVDSATAQALGEAFREFEKNEQLHAAVLTGADHRRAVAALTASNDGIARMSTDLHGLARMLRREAVPLLIAGQLPEAGHIFSKEGRHFATLQKFNLLQHQLNARPKVHNHYFREAWASPHDDALARSGRQVAARADGFAESAFDARRRITRILDRRLHL